MGYDMQLVVFKNKTLESIKKEIEIAESEYPFSDLYSECLYAWLYPEDYKIPKDEEGKYICSENRRIFKGFFDKEIENGEAVIIDKETYSKMFKWLEKKLKSTSLFDLVDSANNEADIYPFIRVYKNMRESTINFEEEFVVFEHDW